MKLKNKTHKIAYLAGLFICCINHDNAKKAKETYEQTRKKAGISEETINEYIDENVDSVKEFKTITRLQ